MTLGSGVTRDLRPLGRGSSAAPVLVFAHGGTIRAAATLGGPETSASALVKVASDNCSITESEPSSKCSPLWRWICVGYLVGVHVRP